MWFLSVIGILLLALRDAENCEEVDIAFGGNDISNINTASWNLCSAACKSLQACKFWTWNNSTGQCYLKTSDSGRASEPDKISGAAGCGVEGPTTTPATTTPAMRCHGQDNGCCTKDTPCSIGQGDCDNDAECAGSLECGENACPWGDNDDCCIVDGVWNQWIEGKCSKTCGIGTKTMNRTCNGNVCLFKDNITIGMEETMEVTCNEVPCPVAAISLKCSELDMKATVDETLLVGNITNMTVVDCNATKYMVQDPYHTISVNFRDCVKNIIEGNQQITQENEICVKTAWTDKTNTVHRVTVYYYSLKCTFDRRLNITHAVAVKVDEKEENFEKSSVTNFTASMTFWKDKQYTAPVQGALQVAAFEPIYIQIQGVHNNTLFKFVTEDCYATPSGDPLDSTRYLFFADKCPIDSTYMEINPNSINEYSFKIDAFTFIKLKKEVYFHCSLVVCKVESTSKECNQTCGMSSRKRRAITDDGALEVVMANSGAVQYKKKPSCEDITCQTNAYCVNLYPAICRCNDGFVFDQSTKECSNILLFTVLGLHLDMQFISSYGDTSSDDFVQLATTVEKNLMTGYGLDRNTIKGVKVIQASPGSVVLDIQLKHAETVTPQEAFDSFIVSVIKTKVKENISNVKRHILPLLESLETQRLEQELSVGIIAVAVVCPIVFIILVAIIIWVVWNRSRSSNEKVTSFNNDAVSLDNVSA